MFKGSTVIELTDVNTGRKEIYEDNNLVTEALSDIFNTNIKGMLYNNTYFNSKYGDAWMLPIKDDIMGGILLYQNPIEERADNIYASLDNPIVGYASDDANNTQDVQRGSRNLTESKKIDGGYKFVWDFATSQANGIISTICLTNTLAGRGTKNGSNYMVRIGSWSADVENMAKPWLERDNKRIYIKEGYRLEMSTFYNSNKAILRKIKDDYLHASLSDRPLTRYVTEPEEETIIELGHQPQYYHYIGGSKDGKNETIINSADVMNYLFHAADRKWYGIARCDKRKYSYGSGNDEVYSHIGTEWYLDTIDGGRCTSKKITVPSGVSDFNGIGMSGKWLMCYTGNKVYRIDTANAANIELVENISYLPYSEWTYIVDDDIVISGWYFLNGEPKLYVSNTPSEGFIAWGRFQMSRYKTYAVREWIYSYSKRSLYRELYLFTPYLATINNLSSPVIKTADKTMKITYTITESES
jgi:hypothetical protein